MNGWRRQGRGAKLRLVGVFDQQEAALLRGLIGQVRTMLVQRTDDVPVDELAELTGITSGHTRPPEDAVLARLLPDFHRDDPELAAMLRAAREPELVAAKTEAATVVLDTCPPDGGRAELTPPQADAWLSALNDVRLALGTTLGVTEDMPDEPPADEALAAHLSVYHWLTFVQDALVQSRAAAM
ncbi:MAG: hypothetical protein QOF38_2285 [Pseudonocardiales bacterium]|uniref:DUF2017 domain-containing protein n=1 Tax=Pseudonocardia sp. Cha107L01 TaxID=3457576 RepID=UPI0028C5D17F|nr:protein of unknown function DUF2017-containing protein [Pseudonocardia sp.]MDT7556455.1 hypothetical protein [Pseudonocardiales bacterium]MDT7568709.1 hypothetical protein [Pseudonocardiales bacterium]MDT7591654.1 hypothetical protein [Pseudonocardiales bacterium]MDT7626374.1 hypothetical protein [Pseudonocardiales bacterium]